MSVNCLGVSKRCGCVHSKLATVFSNSTQGAKKPKDTDPRKLDMRSVLLRTNQSRDKHTICHSEWYAEEAPVSSSLLRLLLFEDADRKRCRVRLLNALLQVAEVARIAPERTHNELHRPWAQRLTTVKSSHEWPRKIPVVVVADL
eukprot:7376477-Prymnesium_polylepis.1